MHGAVDMIVFETNFPAKHVSPFHCRSKPFPSYSNSSVTIKLIRAFYMNLLLHFLTCGKKSSVCPSPKQTQDNHVWFANVILLQIPEKLPASISNLRSCKQVQRMWIITNYACRNVITFTKYRLILMIYILGNNSTLHSRGRAEKRICTIEIMRIRNKAPNLRSFLFHWRSNL